MQPITKIFVYKIIIVIIMIVTFAIIYKLILNNTEPGKHSWLDAFYTSSSNQTFTTNPIQIKSIRIPLMIQNLGSFMLILGIIGLIVSNNQPREDQPLVPEVNNSY
jgi:glycerol uptake facilitator-like aquaporin